MALQRVLNSAARLSGVAVAALVLSATISSPVVAQTTQSPQTPNVQAFLANPQAVLQQNPSGGPTLVSQVRDLAVANPATLTSIIGLLAGASKDQKNAIASGLAQAAKIVVKNNPPYATQIQQAIADTKDQDVVLAYAGAAGDVPIGAAGGAGAGSSGASGGQTTGLNGAPTGTGGAEAINGSSTPTGPFSYTSSVSGGSTTSGTTFTTLTTSVSP
jgi:hypothetical protein